MNDINNQRHSLAHLLASAVLEIYPDAKPTIGPAVDDGFYYDFEFSSPIGDKDLEKIEKIMKKNLPKWEVFSHKEVSADEAKEVYKNNPYKLELIDDISERGEKITLYTSGGFTDLCRGGHFDEMNKIDPESFKLDRLAGAYWKGDEKNKMLTRIYGLSFETKEKLNDFIKNREEAKERDHRKLGKELGLFVFSEIVGKGLPLWTEKGAVIRRELERFIVDEEIKRGYKHVYTPDIAKIELYEKSGHYPYYKDSMYSPIKIDDEEFMLRPMTCPHHFELYLNEPHSYKELPFRIAELAKLYRYEQSGELSGLIRVRNFCLSDAHIICADPEQAGSEVNGALDLIDFIANKFGLKINENYWYRLSLGNRADEKKYYKDDASWDTAEEILRKTLKDRGANFIEAEDEAAFYGPKIDIQMRNVNGKEDTAFTVQYDFVMPKRFDLKYINSEGKEQEPIVVHRSSVGAIERIIAFLIEHYSGNFPLWLSPVQVKVIPIAESHNEKAKEIYDLLKENKFRAELDSTDEGFGKKVRKAKQDRIPYFIIIGDKDIEAGKVTLESRDKGNLGQLTNEEVIEKLKSEL